MLTAISELHLEFKSTATKGTRIVPRSIHKQQLISKQPTMIRNKALCGAVTTLHCGMGRFKKGRSDIQFNFCPCYANSYVLLTLSKD